MAAVTNIYVLSVIAFLGTVIPTVLGSVEDLDDVKQNIKWNLLAHRNEEWGWDHDRTPFAVSALALSDENLFNCNNLTGILIKKQLQLELAKLLLRKKDIPISSGILAAYINALKATCQDPHNFLDFNLVSMMRHTPAANDFENAMKSLAICNAGHKISKETITNLTHIFRHEPKSVHNGLDTQAMAALAIACSRKHHQGTFVHNILKDAITLFKHFQKADGSFGNIFTTALITQVFIASGQHMGANSRYFNKAVHYLKMYYKQENQQEHSKHSVVMGHYFVLPITNLKSLAHLKHQKCECQKVSEHAVKQEHGVNDLWSHVEEIYNETPLEPEDNSDDSDVIPKIAVTYSLWNRHENSEQESVNISTVIFIDEGETFLDVMKKASDDDRFNYLLQNTALGPLVHRLAGVNNDQNASKYWLLYKLQKDNRLRIVDKGVAEIKPKDNDHFIFIYQKIS